MTIIDALAKTATTTKKYVDTTFGTKLEVTEVNTKAETAIEIAKGASRAIVLGGYDYVVNELLYADENQFRQGDNIYLYDIDVPDLWISAVHNWEYTDYSWND